MFSPGRKQSSSARRERTRKWPENGPPRNQNGVRFLARGRNDGKCSALAFTLASLPTTKRLSHAVPGDAGLRRATGLNRRHAGHGGRLRCSTTRSARETPRSCPSPGDRRRARVAAGSVGPLGTGPSRHAPRTGTSRSWFCIADGGAGSDHTGWSRDGRLAGRVRCVRAGDLTGACAGRIGPCPAEWEAFGTTANRSVQKRPGGGPLPCWGQ